MIQEVTWEVSADSLEDRRLEQAQLVTGDGFGTRAEQVAAVNVGLGVDTCSGPRVMSHSRLVCRATPRYRGIGYTFGS